MPKLAAVRALMLYLARYLGDDRQRRLRLRTFYKKTTGAAINRTALWVHTTLRKEPTAPIVFVYLEFLFREKAIIRPRGKAAFPALSCGGLFEFKFPELLKRK